jgi:predicted TIM-barrel fold metal-dependent hydrolase
MIIDIHAHIFSEDLPNRNYWDGYVKFAAAVANRPEERIWNRIKETWDLSGELIISDMDEAGIDKSIIMVADFGLTLGIGEGKYSLEEQNKIYADLAAKYPDRLIAFFGIDPRRPGAHRQFERAVKEWGMGGLKLLPPTGFYPNDKEVFPLYAKAEELGVPVLIHTGPETIPLFSKYGQPIYLDEVCNYFPDLNIIAAHGGYCWMEELIDLASNKTNLYIDLAAWQTKTRRRKDIEFYKTLRHVLNTIGARRVLFGSDWPPMRLYMSQKDWVNVFKEIPDYVKEAGIEFKDEEIDLVLGGTAAKVLGLEK